MSQFFPDEIWDILSNHKISAENTGKLRKYFSEPQFDPTRRTIVFSTPSRTGTSFFRLELPMYAIAANYPEKFNLVYADNNLNPKHLEIADLIVAHRAGHLHDWMHNIFKVWPKTRKRAVVIHDVDDNEFNLPMRHPMREMWYAAEKDKMAIRSLKESDFVTTTGWKLQQTFRNFNKNVSVMRNMFDWEQPQWKHQPSDKKDWITIGWVGLTSHFEDIKKMKPIMKFIHDKYPKTKFVLSGMAIKDTEVTITLDENGKKKFDEKEITEESRTYRFRVREMFKDFAPNRIEFHDAIELEEYGKFYNNLDIGLAYLENLTFNQCKSEIKVVEYMKYGVVPLWMNIGGYRDMHNSMPEHLKQACRPLAIETENPQRWIEMLEDTVVHIDKWRKVAQECKSWVEEVYDINKQIHDRVDFYTNTIEEHLEKEVNRVQGILAHI